jgi:hypothetical protein
VLAIIVGFILLSQVTTGVGVIGAGCFLGIAARVVQAEEDERRRSPTAPSAPISE